VTPSRNRFGIGMASLVALHSFDLACVSFALPTHNLVVFQTDGPSFAMDFDSRGESGIGTSGGFDDPDGAI
jgi:hypothetical protein